MTKEKPIATKDVEQYKDLRLGELEERVEKLARVLHPTREMQAELRLMRAAVTQRKKIIKGRVMSFEDTNDHHLLFFDSTGGFWKLAGNSVLFYSLKVAERIGRRCKVLPDKDHYIKSEEGIVSIRAVDTLVEKLAMLDILPDETLNRDELHFFKLPRIYTPEQIEKLRDCARQDLERIQEIIVPKSPLPELYRDILEVNQLIYHNVRNMHDSVARDVIGKPLLRNADAILQSYLNFANVRVRTTWARAEVQNNVAKVEGLVAARVAKASGQNLMNLLIKVRQLKNRMSNVENLRLIHIKQVGDILARVVKIELAAEREYGKILREEKLT